MNDSKHVVAAVAVMAVAMGACTTTRYGGPTFSPEAAGTIREREGSGRPIELLDPQAAGPVVDADRVVGVTHDATVLRRPDGSELLIRNDRIEHVQVRGRARGAAEGALIGLLAGAASGAAIGYFTNAEPKDGAWFTPRETALMGAAGLGAISMACGALLGAVIGHTTTYVFDK